jgi:prepilin-type N-terminal cleavage/methylation domain-containing protein
MFAKFKLPCPGSRKQSRGLTLIEIMMVVLIGSLALSTIFRVFSSTSTVALSGMVQSELVLETRRTLRQIHDDLKYGVFYVDYNSPVTETVQDCFDRMLVPSFGEIFSVLRFPLHGPVEQSIQYSNGGAYRVPVRISYSIVKEGPMLFALYRREGDALPRCLTRRVNFFKLTSHPGVPDHTAWMVNLQLVETSGAPSHDRNLMKLRTVADEAYDSPNRRLQERTAGVQVSDFFDTVSSDYYTCCRRSNFIPNWQTLLINR